MSTEIELSPAEVQPVGEAPEHSDDAYLNEAMDALQ